MPFFRNNNINGCRLLLLSTDDLDSLNVTKIGHQEIILDAVDLLKHLHYNFCTETLQTLALKLGCKARSLFNHLKAEALNNNPTNDEKNNKIKQRVSTKTLSGVCDIMSSVKSLISWIDRYPFDGQDDYVKIRKNILKLSIELASTAQRDQFVEQPNDVIKQNCKIFAEICDRIVQDLNDSLAIQPAWLDVVPIKKTKDEKLGLHIHSSYCGIHIIGGIKFQSAADMCTRIDEGDEIVQINYQTVVGWQLKKLVNAMKEFPAKLTLTLKKRPRHSTIAGQLTFLKAYKIPSIKLKSQNKFHRSPSCSSSSSIPDTTNNQVAKSPITKEPCKNISDVEIKQIQSTNDAKQCHVMNPIYQLLPRRSRIKPVRRRATIGGGSPVTSTLSLCLDSISYGKDSVTRSVSHDDTKSDASVNLQKTDSPVTGHRLSLPDTSSTQASSLPFNTTKKSTIPSSNSSSSPPTPPPSLSQVPLTKVSSLSTLEKCKSATLANKPKELTNNGRRYRSYKLRKVRKPKSSISQSDSSEDEKTAISVASNSGDSEYSITSERLSDDSKKSCATETDTINSQNNSINSITTGGSTSSSGSLSDTCFLELKDIKKEKPIVPKKSLKVQQLILMAKTYSQ